MAERRMFTKRITDDDHFMSLSSSAQALYLHLSMAADDDGFCNQVTLAMFKAHASTQDLEALLTNRYIYQFDNGVIVIKHWRMANALRKDRYTQTAFKKELAQLEIDENGAYTMTDGCRLVADWLPDGCQMGAVLAPQDRLGKDRIDKDRLDKGIDEQAKPAKPPKHKHGEYSNVLLTDEEMDKLLAEYGASKVAAMIDRLSGYIASTGKVYKSHYATIRNWVRKEGDKNPTSGGIDWSKV